MDGSLAPLLSVALGVGLAAATGLRVFLPLLVAGVAARMDFIPLTDAFAWLASMPALIMLGVAAAIETLAYYIPGVDHVLDLLAAPAAMIAGVIASAAVMTDIPPAVMWPVAIIAGGGIAGITKGGAALTRAKTGVTTAGLGNPVVSTAETVTASTLSILAIALPIVCFITVLALVVWIVRKMGARLVRAARRRGSDSSSI